MQEGPEELAGADGEGRAAMETVLRAGWQHPGRGAASPPHGSRWARVRELVSSAPHSPFGAPNAMGNESGIISAALLPSGSIPPLLSPFVPFPLEHTSLLQPWLHTLKDLFYTSWDEWKIGDVHPGWTAEMGWVGGRWGGEWGATAPLCAEWLSAAVLA